MGREVTIVLKTGDSLVMASRDGRRPWPLAMDMTMRAKEFTELSNDVSELDPGDVLSFPHDVGQMWVSVKVKTEGLWAQWDRLLAARFPGYPMSCPALRLTFAMVDTCPHCGTEGGHDAEMVDLPTTENRTTIARRYVVRTCLTCGNSWEQETEW